LGEGEIGHGGKDTAKDGCRLLIAG
jgi:hypothetical protein